MSKYGEVLDCRTIDKAVIGKQYIFSYSLKELLESPEKCEINKLSSIACEQDYPFLSESDNYYYQFCREVIEEEVRMTERQLAEWLEKGNGQKAYLKNEYEPKEGIDLEPVFTTHEYDGRYDDEPCGEAVRIRSWGSDEWVKPTLEIYERDCKGSIPWA